MPGTKGHSGRKKSFSKQIENALEQVDANIEAIFQTLITKAIEGDKDCAIYLIDRRLGRPHSSLDARIKGELHISADELQLAISAAQHEEHALLYPIINLIE